MTLCGCHKNIYKLRATEPVTSTRNLNQLTCGKKMRTRCNRGF